MEMNRPSTTELQAGKEEFLLLEQTSTDKQKLLDSALEKLSTEFETNTYLRNELVNSKKLLHEKEEELVFIKRHFFELAEDIVEKQSELELVRASISSIVSECETLKISCKEFEDAVFKLEVYISKSELLLEEVSIFFFYMLCYAQIRLNLFLNQPFPYFTTYSYFSHSTNRFKM